MKINLSIFQRKDFHSNSPGAHNTLLGAHDQEGDAGDGKFRCDQVVTEASAWLGLLQLFGKSFRNNSRRPTPNFLSAFAWHPIIVHHCSRIGNSVASEGSPNLNLEGTPREKCIFNTFQISADPTAAPLKKVDQVRALYL